VGKVLCVFGSIRHVRMELLREISSVSSGLPYVICQFNYGWARRYAHSADRRERSGAAQGEEVW